MEKFGIRFYEGSYQFNHIVVEAEDVHEVTEGAFKMLNQQYNYRPTQESLWAMIYEADSRVIRYEVVRLTDKTYKWKNLKNNSSARKWCPEQPTLKVVSTISTMTGYPVEESTVGCAYQR